MFMDGYGLVRGFEMLKLSNLDNSLATPNPLPPEDATCSFLCSLGSLKYADINQAIACIVCIENFAS